MQQMQNATTGAADQVAAALLESVPLVMRAIRAQMRGYRTADLSVPQFRALGFLHRNPGAPLTGLAEHIGLTLPAASRLVDGLVARGYVARKPSPADRRTLELTVSPPGVAMLEASRARARAHLAQLLATLPPEDREAVQRAAEILRDLFGPRGPQAMAAAAASADSSPE